MRHTTRSTRFFRFASIAVFAVLPYASPPRHAFAFEGEGDAGTAGGTGTAGAGGAGGGAGAGAGGEGGGDNPPRRPAKMYSEQEFNAATRARDAAKKKMQAIVKTLGLDLDDVTIVETGDTENPYAVEGLDDIVEAARKAGGDSESKKRAEADRKKRILAPVQSKLNSAEKKITALTDWIAKNAIVAPIRAACIAEKIVDDDGGKFSDIVALLKPRFKTTVELDEDDREAIATISIVAMNEEGDDAIEGSTGDPWTDARKMVAELARVRPKYKQSEFRAGPGAGGARLGNRGNGSPGTVTPDAKRDRMLRQVAGHYGVRPEEIGEASQR